jgi:succinate dehydrogenase / fumarate reductase, cytochrome b subunit
MTATTAPESSFRHLISAGHRPFYLARLHSLTGILFGGYIIVHLLINATLAEGYRTGDPQTVFQRQVNTIDSVPFLRLTVWTLIYLPIIYHTLYGLWLTYGGKPNINQYPYGKNAFYLVQRISALVLVAFIFFHVTAMKGFWSDSLKFDRWHATESTVAHLNSRWFIGWFVYPVGIFAACYHLAYGFWTAAITWGLTISSGAQRRWGWVCLALFVFTFTCGITALVAGLTSAATAHHG